MTSLSLMMLFMSAFVILLVLFEV